MPVEIERERTPSEIERSQKVSMSRTVNKVYHLARSNSWDWFVTLTFDPEKVDSFDYEAVTKKLSKWLNNLKSENADLKYIIVPEKHKSGRFHFHGLFRGLDGCCFSESGKHTSSGLMIYNMDKYRFGWSTATQIKDQASCTKYIAKYITKDLCQVSFGKKRYWASRGLQEAETQELILENDKLKLLEEKLLSAALHVKEVSSGEMKIMYFELEVPKDVDETL